MISRKIFVKINVIVLKLFRFLDIGMYVPTIFIIYFMFFTEDD